MARPCPSTSVASQLGSRGSPKLQYPTPAGFQVPPFLSWFWVQISEGTGPGRTEVLSAQSHRLHGRAQGRLARRRSS